MERVILEDDGRRYIVRKEVQIVEPSQEPLELETFSARNPSGAARRQMFSVVETAIRNSNNTHEKEQQHKGARVCFFSLFFSDFSLRRDTTTTPTTHTSAEHHIIGL